MVALVTLKDGRDVSNDTFRAGVVLAWTRKPGAGVLDVDLPRGVDVIEELAGADGDRVFLVVDVGHGRRERVDVVREGLIPDARQPIPDERVGSIGDV